MPEAPPTQAIGTGDQTIAVAATTGASRPQERPVHVLVRREGDLLQVVVGEAPVVLGRADTADVILADGRVSKRHCRVQCVDGEMHVTDLNSTNGTLIDESRIIGTAVVPVGGSLRVGNSMFAHELRSIREVQVAGEMAAELRKARDYVSALLPQRWTEGPVRAHWEFQPSSILGGDAFGYHRLTPDHVGIYLIDVCGHGAGAAMHSVAVINTLRQQSLPGVDFTRPAEVLRGLNQAFDMERHHGMYFSAWYGAYHVPSRILTCASAGHPPALLRQGNGLDVVDLQTRCLPVGTFPQGRFTECQSVVAPGSALYVFSDGVYEVTTRTGEEWSLAGFRALVARPRTEGPPECTRLRQAITEIAGKPQFADDFSLLVMEFP